MVFSIFISFSERGSPVLCTLEGLLCHKFVSSFLVHEWPDFCALLKYSVTNAFLCLLDTPLLIHFLIQFAFDTYTLCWQVTLNLLSTSIVNKIFYLHELSWLINNLNFWCLHAHSCLFYAIGPPWSGISK